MRALEPRTWEEVVVPRLTSGGAPPLTRLEITRFNLSKPEALATEELSKTFEYLPR